MTDGKLFSGQSLRPGDTLVSPGGHARLHYQHDGNLVVYLDGAPFWASHTDQRPSGALKMRADGNLVISDGSAGIASTGTQGHPGAMVQLQDDGNFVIYEDPRGPLAGTPIWASSTSVFMVGPVEAEPAAAVLPMIKGRVRLLEGGRKGIADDTGRRLVVPVHAGDFLARIINDPNGKRYVSAQLDHFAAVGVHCPRIWFFLPSVWWRTPPRPGNAMPTDPRWTPAVEWLCAQLVQRGLYLQYDGGDFFAAYPNHADRVPVMRMMGSLLKQTGVGLFSVGMGNESWQNGEDSDANSNSVRRMSECLQAFKDGYGPGMTDLTTLTSARDEGLLNDYVRGTSVPSVISYHGSRGHFRHATERVWTAGYADSANAEERMFREYKLDDEPVGVNNKDGPTGSGPGTHVSATENPAEWRNLEAYGVYMLAHYLTRQTPTVFCSPGVVSDEPFSDYPCIELTGRLAALLPRDIQAWKHFHGGYGRDFSPLRVLGVDHLTGNHVRCEHALNQSTGEVAVLCYVTQPGSYRLDIVNSFNGVILTPDLGLTSHPLNLVKGQHFGLECSYGRLLLGHVR